MSTATTTSTGTSFRAGFNRFFFAEEVPYGMALARILVPLSLMHNVLVRWPWARELYSTDGATAQLGDNFGHFNYLPEFSGTVTIALYTLMTVLFITSIIGWRTRLSLLGAAVLYFYFQQIDAISTITKYTVIAVHLLLLLGLSNCGAIWSVDRWLSNRRGRGMPLASCTAPIWPQRLMQLLLGIIYFGAAVTKLHTPAYFSGDQLMYWMMTYLNNAHPLGDYLTQHPVMIVVCSYLALVWEITFLFTVWRPWLRVPVLVVGTIFHLMTWFTLGLIVFPMVMISAYFCFVTEDDVRRLAHRFRGLRQRISRLIPQRTAPRVAGGFAAPRVSYASPVAFAFTAAIAIVAGIEVEYRMDPYQLRGPNGPLPLAEMDQARVRHLLGPEVPLRQVDKFHAFDIGTTVVGEHMLNRRNKFQIGESIIAQITLHAPHEDLWVDCNVHEARTEVTEEGTLTSVGPIIHRMGQIVPRESLRSHFGYNLDDGLAPGEYLFVLRSGGQEIARQSFTLTAPPRAAAAN